MPLTRPNKRRGPRGWMLVEVAVGGVMASVVMATLLVNLGAAMDKTVVQGRLLTATMLAQQGIEQSRQTGTDLIAQTGTVLAVPSGLTGTYTRTRTVTAGTDTIGATVLQQRNITITVTFATNDGKTKTVQLETRVEGP